VKKLSDSVRSDLEAGVSLTRLAQISEVAASTSRNYEKERLLEVMSGSGKKLYGMSALEAALEVKRLRDTGLSLKEIAAQHGGMSEPVPAVETPVKTASTAATAEELKARIEALREQLAGEKAKLERVGTRQMQRKNELALTKKELEEIERLRESNVRRALEVTRRATSLSGQLQYSMARPGILRMKTPMVPRKRK
jgi:DNA-binding transcriptional MerR regulator